ncbi:MAG TPA: translation initiation factor IF-2 [Clostridiales bacterium]|jgi:translation initiation factor IF-2|nr:translation initiation factor IF-2 [Clostridiales bacterium]HPZ05377.1 translation initiation factor IF-2 [Clostridiales bacterium]
MEKVRVYELAKELNTTSKRLMEKLAEIDIKVKNHMSLLDKEELEALYKHIGVIRHDEKKNEPEEPKTPPVVPVQPKPDMRRRNAPRIIRTTEIIIDSKDDSNASGKGGSKGGRSSYVRTADANTGLLSGFVRRSRTDYINTMIATQKQDPVRNEQETEARGASEMTGKEPLKPEAKTEAQAEKKDVKKDREQVRKSDKEKDVRKEKKTSAETVDAAKEKKARSDVKQASEIKSSEAVADTKTADKQHQSAGATAAAEKPASPEKTGQDSQSAVSRKTADKKTGKDAASAEKAKADRPKRQDTKAQTAKTQKQTPGSQGVKGQKSGSGYSQPVRQLDIPMPEFKEESVPQRSESRREFSGRDADKGVRREQRKESPRMAAGKSSKKIKPANIGLHEKKGVSEVLSEDFLFGDFYDDRGVRKRKQSRQKRSKDQGKHIPPKAVLTHIRIPESLTVKELAEALKKTSSEVIKKLMGYGVMATLNQEVDFDTAAIVADEFGVKAEKEIVLTEEDILFDDEQDDPEKLVPRPPVVVVMGHVDHGKTSLLDAIRSTHVIESEAGGITQHIGAYTVQVNGRNITFLDTPGHEAFTAMRARGAQVTDVAILVVAADDGVMPQTVEAINHARSANVSIIVAVNKIDKPGANPERVKQELTQHGLVPEEWGGDIICVEISAKKRQNIDQLLEMVLLTADVLELKADPTRQAKGTVIEAKLDKNRGAVATLLVQRGTLNVGDSIIAGTVVGRIRAMSDDKGKAIKSAGPSTPVEILGMPEVPEAGETFYAITDEKTARQLAEKRKLKQQQEQQSTTSKISLDDLYKQIQEGKVKDLNLIVKADVQGTVEALKQSLEKLSNDEVRVNVIHGAVGAITESDVTFADVSNAIIIGFNVRPVLNVGEAAKRAGVDIRLYNVIYNAIEDMEAAMKGMLEPTYREVVQGHVEVRQIFRISGIGTIAGGYVLDGKITRNSGVRVVRDGIVIHEGTLASLKRFKDDVKEVLQGFECGLSIERFNDIKENDIIESFIMEEVER